MFSGAALLADLDDFIAPSQSCVNPLFSGAAEGSGAARLPGEAGASNESKRGAAKLDLASDFLVPGDTGVRPDLIKSTGATKAAQVSLNDCLACSGCVTSAETVLIQQQSTEEMLRALADPRYEVFVASLSHQALASIAAHFGEPDALSAYTKVSAYLRSLGFHYVIDTQPAAELALAESCREFVARARAEHAPPAPAQWAAPPASLAVSSTRVQYVTATSVGGVATAAGAPVLVPDAAALGAAPSDDINLSSSTTGATSSAPYHSRLPILASACPGWVCYAEKTVPEALPFVSAVKSQQQLTGTLVKHVLSGGALLPAALRGAASSAGDDTAPLAFRHTPHSGAGPVHPSKVYHVTVMQCFDKKLEASRKDFEWEFDAADSASAAGTGFREGVAGDSASSVKEVDCVITPAELVALLASNGTEWASLQPESRKGYYPPVSGGDGADTCLPVIAIDFERVFTGVTSDGRALVGAPAGQVSSDGYAEVLLRHAARELHGITLPLEAPIVWAPGKNPDFHEAVVRRPADGAEVLRFALAYGFRNIQTVVTRMKRGKAPVSGMGRARMMPACATRCRVTSAHWASRYHPHPPFCHRALPQSPPLQWQYVEIMACPSGCVNGGGQIKPVVGEAAGAQTEQPTSQPVALDDFGLPLPPKTSGAKPNPLKAAAEAGRKRTATVMRMMQERAAPGPTDPTTSPVVALLERAAGVASLPQSSCRLLLHTRYHTVPKLETAAMKW